MHICISIKRGKSPNIPNSIILPIFVKTNLYKNLRYNILEEKKGMSNDHYRIKKGLAYMYVEI